MIGRLIGKYRITRQLGQGGMGVVFEAVHTELGQRAAVKVLRPEVLVQPDMVRRFFNEARAVALAQHPGLVKIFDFGRLDGEHGEADPLYILMEYLEGEPLRTRLQRRGGALDAGEALRMARQIASTLHITHGKGIIHRDLKPENVIVVHDPETTTGERVKLLDFGIAKILPLAGDAGDADLRTRPGAILGSPRYMAPEQWRGEGITDKVDVYALGVMLHEMLLGRPPFDTKTPGDLLVQHLTQKPSPLREILPALPEAISALVLRMLEKDPAARPTMGEVAGEVAAALSVHEGQMATADEEGPAGEVGRVATLPLSDGDQTLGPLGPVLSQRASLATPTRPGLPQPSRLEQLVEQDLLRARPQPRSTAGGPVPQLTPKKFQDIMTAFVLYQGERFFLPGTVLRQRGISIAEAATLVTGCGVGARFLIGPETGVPSAAFGAGAGAPSGSGPAPPASATDPFHVTVYTVLPGHTRSLQERLESRQPAALLLRVLVVPPGPSAPFAHGPPGKDGFPGFHMYGSQNPHPWTLVVDEMIDPG